MNTNSTIIDPVNSINPIGKIKNNVNIIKPVRKTLFLIFMTILACLFIFPLIWMVVSSFKTEPMIYGELNSIKAFTLPAFNNNYFHNYVDVLNKLPIIKAELNSFFYIIIIIICSLIVNSMAGYGFARLEFPLKNLIFSLLLALIIIPSQTIMLPLFSIVYKLGWVNNYLGLIVPAVASPFFIFLFRQTFKGIPEDIEEAATIDGASTYTIFFKIVMPLARPIYATVSILIFIASWNDFIWPVMIISDPAKATIQMAISTLFSIQPRDMGQIMAALTFVTIPVLVIFLFMQKYYVQGIAGTGSKN